MLSPGQTIGILGGGQLGRMLALAAARLGLDCHIYAPEAESPAFAVSAASTVADYRDEAALARFAASVDAITYEFENVPVETVRFLEALKPVRPGSKALEVAQERLAEKRLARSLGARTAEFAEINSLEELRDQVKRIGLPAVIKTNRFGYDGKGQAKILIPEDIAPAFAALKGQQGILESFVSFDREVSVVAARAEDGTFAAFDVTENEHRHHILHRSVVPARISDKTAAEAIGIARKIGEALDYVGTFAVEFFLVDGAAGGEVIVNEIAPRVHNSGHWTMDGAFTCQFEQHIRAVAGWPLGDPARLGSVEMINLVGADAARWLEILGDGRAHLHLYGKTEMRDGRKMGHVNRIL
ncbi:MAG: 5-(carboxyamino)imidazole ribonucleotide synthase [Rhizobiales bacterium PAR1]|nr:MAG: 5-(carboxyamino)imidazole ribonucleotide synthase [Rhizobiales bacterium PAR1]